jgi:flagellar hook-associated protein 3 FlgL
MNYRVTDNSTALNFTSRVNAQRTRLSVLQERIASGKRINRPSDDPNGAEAVLKLRTSQSEIEQFKRTAQTANQKLTTTDDSLTGYENLLERVRTLVGQGLSDTATQDAKNALATEIDSLRSRILNVANAKFGDEYIYGGTRQNAPPFDPTTAVPAAAPTSAQYIQIEPGTNAVAVGVTADTVFSDATSTIFTDLTNAAAALRGTGTPATDRTTLETTMTRLGIYSGLVNNAQGRVGANMNATEIAQDNLSNNFLSLDERANAIEGDDFAATALQLADTQRSLEATLQVAAQGRKSLFDFLG